MRRRGAWRIGTGGSNLFFILSWGWIALSGAVVGRPAEPRRRDDGGADATGRRPIVLGSPRPLGLPPAGRDSPRAVAPERPVGGVCVPICGSPTNTNQFGTLPQREKNSSFAVRGLLRAARHASLVRSAARANSRLSIHLGRGGVNCSLRRAAKSFKRNWVAPHPSQKRRKHKNGVAAPGWRPSSAAAHCPCSSDAARRRGDCGLSLEPHC